MAKRLFDILFAVVALLISTPFILFGMIGIKMASPGPVIYSARRIGKNGEAFAMFKLRSMHVTPDGASTITAPGDSRIFVFGDLIRRTKIDELPQFWNVLRGDMSIVGPRAEAPGVVETHYTDWMRETLDVAPGLTSPGAIYNYMMSDILLDPQDPEGSYVSRMLRPKLALERAYVESVGFVRDLCYIVLTIAAIFAHQSGGRVRILASDVALARKWAPDGPYPD